MAARLARFVVDNRVLVNLVGLAMIVVGALAMSGMTRESFPSVATGWCQVITLWPGASPTDVEQLVTSPLEDAIDEVDGIAAMWSASREGRSAIFMELDPGVPDIGRKVIEISNAVNRVSDLPAGVERPAVREYEVSFPTISVAVRGDTEERVLREVGRRVRERLERLPGVSEVQTTGIRRRQIQVDVDPDRLLAHRLPITAVSDALAARGRNVPAGAIDGGGDRRLVRGMARVDDADAVRSVVVRPDPEGGAVTVADVARVHEGFASTGLGARVNGEPAIVLLVHKEREADAIELSAAVRALVDRQRQETADGVSIDLFGDLSHEVERSLGALYDNAAVGLALVIALLWLFVGARNATMAALGIPVALAGGVAVMHLLGISINMLSLLALILCLGVVVDDAIIIIENIHRHMEEGRSRRDAAIAGMREVFWPVVSSTLTTVAAFLPLLLMTGVIGTVFSIIPKVVVAALCASLLEAFFILPSHMADFGQAGSGGARTRWTRIGERVEAAYARVLRAAIAPRRRLLVVVSAYGVGFALVGVAAATEDVVLFTDADVDLFDVRVRMPGVASRERTETALEEIERRLLALPTDDIEAVITIRGMVRNDLGIELGDHVGMSTVHLRPADLRPSHDAGERLLERASPMFTDLVGPTSLEVVEFRPGPPRGAPVAVRTFGEDMDRLVEISEAVVGELRSIPGTRDPAHNHEPGKQELQVSVDEERAALHGLTAPVVARALAHAFGAVPVTTTRVGGDEEVDVVVRLEARARGDAAALRRMHLGTADGASVTLGEIATLGVGRSPSVIRHRDRRRMVTTTARIDDDVTTSQEVNRLLLARLEPLVDANPDLQIELGGEYEDTEESLGSLFRAFGLAAMLIFVILATQFRSLLQPFVVMGAIPLALVGVAVGWLVTDTPMGLIALVGVVGLSGIVVNDSLVLVDFVNQRRRDGMPLDEAIVEAGRLRLRPIFLTSVTTIAGLVPIAVTPNLPLLSPMASAIAWGLTFATLLTLVIVPCMLRLSADVSMAVARALGPVRSTLTGAGEEHDRDADPLDA